MRSGLFLLFIFLTSFARADVLYLQYMHEASTRSYLLCSSAMVYFNPQDRAPDPRSLTAYFDNLNTLNTKVTQLGQPPELTTPLRSMEQVFMDLDGTPRSRSSKYPAKIRELLLINQQMQTDLATMYKAELAATPSALVMLNDQSKSIAGLLMDYQLRRYPLPDKEGLLIPEAQLAEIDAAIEERFSLLMKKYPDRVAILDKVRKNYMFVRTQLLQAKGRPNGGAEFYITRSVTDLNELALEIALSAEGQDPTNPQNY